MITGIEIGNMRDARKGQPLPEGWVYVARPTALGNPYKLPHAATEAQRAAVIANYARWLDGMLHQPGSDAARMLATLEQQAREGEGVMTLICFCKQPGKEVACHADVIAARLRARLGLPEPGQEGGQQGEPDSSPGSGGEAQG